MNKLLHLEPTAVFKYFEEITQIPRCSGAEEKISDYLREIAKKLGLEVIQDEVNNILIKKPGTKGYEKSPGVILQGHMDMVCEKNKETKHDFAKDPLELEIKEDMIYAKGTTLGADNGIALAMALAILESQEIPHPPLEVLITVDEETGMKGVLNFDAKNLAGKYLINLDNEEEGKLLVSCAGGLRVKHYLKITWEHIAKNANCAVISVKGLKGGHSGMDIAKERGNANKLLGRILQGIYQKIAFNLQDISGGSKMNAIPREAEATIILKPENRSLLLEEITYWQKTLANEFKTSDPEITVDVDFIDPKILKNFNHQTTEKVITALMLIPNGVKSMSMEIKDLVVSSTNLGIVSNTEEEVIFESALRSSVESLKQLIFAEAKEVARVLDCKIEADGDYPAWEYNPRSELKTICENVYAKIYNQKPETVAIHAGVECGLLLEKKPDLDVISFGPNIYDVHSPNEHLSISSTKNTYAYLLEILKALH